MQTDAGPDRSLDTDRNGAPDLGENILKIQLEPEGPVAFRLAWTYEPFDSEEALEISDYLVSTQHLRDAGKKVRDMMREFAKCSSLPTDSIRSRQTIEKLRNAGVELYRAIFICDEKSPNVQEELEYAQMAKDWFENFDGEELSRIRIEVTTEPQNAPDFVIPWGLVYPEQSAASDTRDTNLFDIHDQFWVIRHKLTAYESKRAPKADRVEGAVDFQQMMFHAYIRGDINIDQELRNVLGTHLRESAGDLMNNAPVDRPNVNHLYYLNRRDPDHDPGTTHDRLTYEGVIELARSDGINHSMLGMIDGTAVMNEPDASEWYRAFFRHNWTAFIITEVDSYLLGPLDFAGLNIIQLLGQIGGTITDAMHETRQHVSVRPWGLLFALYADPKQVYFQKPPDTDWNETVKDACDTLERQWERRNNEGPAGNTRRRTENE